MSYFPFNPFKYKIIKKSILRDWNQGTIFKSYSYTYIAIIFSCAYYSIIKMKDAKNGNILRNAIVLPKITEPNCRSLDYTEVARPATVWFCKSRCSNYSALTQSEFSLLARLLRFTARWVFRACRIFGPHWRPHRAFPRDGGGARGPEGLITPWVPA